MSTKNSVITVENVCKSFNIGAQTVQVLKDISFSITEGDFLVIFGPSGCGKSTLLHTILGLEVPSSGNVKFMDIDLYGDKDEDVRNGFRKQHVGMVYQQANWIKSFTVKENIAFPLMLLGRDKDIAQQKAVELLEQIDLAEWADYMPTELSSGQQQRVSVIRAMINNPMVIIADEPTGNLDYETGQVLMQYLYDLNKSLGKTVIMVTHDLEYIKFAKTAVQMLDGKVVTVYHGKDIEKLSGTLKTKRGVGMLTANTNTGVVLGQSNVPEKVIANSNQDVDSGSSKKSGSRENVQTSETQSELATSQQSKKKKQKKSQVKKRKNTQNVSIQIEEL